jgi:hypothetical protein
MTTMEGLAAELTGRSAGNETTPEIEAAAKAAGLVIIYADQGDDLILMRGAVTEETYDLEFYLDGEGFIPQDRDDSWDDEEMYDHLRRKVGEENDRAKVTAALTPSSWIPGGAWRFECSARFATFEIFDVHQEGLMHEDDAEPVLYCTGIVVKLPERNP